MYPPEGVSKLSAAVGFTAAQPINATIAKALIRNRVMVLVRIFIGGARVDYFLIRSLAENQISYVL